MESSSSFSPAHYFPQRRRVLQACINCSKRKTRCDGVKPKCSLCMAQNVNCVYRDAPQPRIEQNTRILLERIQLLEDRLMSSPVFTASPTTTTPTPSQTSQQGHAELNQSPGLQQSDRLDSDVPIPLSHTASANHVYMWPIVQQLLNGDGSEKDPTDPTGIFFEPSSSRVVTSTPSESWRLFRGHNLSAPAKAIAEYRYLVDTYFAEITVFYPLLSLSEVLETLEAVAASELGTGHDVVQIMPARYALLLLVLCLSSFVGQGKHIIRTSEASSHYENVHTSNEDTWLDQHLWTKAKLLLGCISSELSLDAAQCAMIASIYTGARGRVAKSFHWAQTAAMKCEALVRMAGTNRNANGEFSDAFRRLYWIAFIYEGDFGSEISITGPSGIAKFEDVVPYPVFEPPSMPPEQDRSSLANNQADPSPYGGISSIHQIDELIAFQISTNAAIRRFLNRVNSLVYDGKKQYRMTRSDYATWLMRVTDDLWSHHTAIYRNVPDFLLTSRFNQVGGDEGAREGTPSTPGFMRVQPLGNNPWNVLRLKGRYYAGQYIIHRPFIEYVLLNLARFESHPCRAAVLDKCSLCLEGCRGFIKVFDTDLVNTITCLFATGIVTFTMVIILQVCTVSPVFSQILPQDIEEAIFLGKRNLQRFSKSIREFQWHLQVLERLDAARAVNSGIINP